MKYVKAESAGKSQKELCISAPRTVQKLAVLRISG
jgi:hypothetical protein